MPKPGQTIFYRKPVSGSWYGKGRKYPQKYEYQTSQLGREGLARLQKDIPGAQSLPREAWLKGLESELATSKQAGTPQPQLEQTLATVRAGKGMFAPDYVAPGFEGGLVPLQPTERLPAVKPPTPTPTALASQVTPTGLPALGKELPFPQATATQTAQEVMAEYQAKHTYDPATKKWYEKGAAPTAPTPTEPTGPAGYQTVETPSGYASVPTEQAGQQYQIQQGDTLSQLAQRFGTTVDALMASNPQIKDPNLIYAGSNLNLPTGQQVPGVGAGVAGADAGVGAGVGVTGAGAGVVQPGGVAGGLTAENVQAMISQGFEGMMSRMEQATTAGATPQETFDLQKAWGEFKTEMGQKIEDFSGSYTAAMDELAASGQSSVDQLRRYREEQGMPQLEKMISSTDQTILQVEGLLTNLSEDIKARTEGLPVSESARRKLQQMEGMPLEKRLSDLLRGRARVAAEYQTKAGVVGQFMQAEKSDFQRRVDVAKAKLGLEEKVFGFESEMLGKEFDLTVGEIDYLRGLPAEQADLLYKQALTLKALRPADVSEPTQPTSFREWELAGRAEGTGMSYAQWLDRKGTTAGTTFKFSSSDKKRLFDVGLRESDITDLQADLREFGKEAVLDNLENDEQRTTLSNILAGITPTQAGKIEEEEAEKGKTIEDFKTSISDAIERLQGFGYDRGEAKSYIINEYSQDGKVKIPDTIKNVIEDTLVEVYSRTIWQKLIPYGR